MLHPISATPSHHQSEHLYHPNRATWFDHAFHPTKYVIVPFLLRTKNYPPESFSCSHSFSVLPTSIHGSSGFTLTTFPSTNIQPLPSRTFCYVQSEVFNPYALHSPYADTGSSNRTPFNFLPAILILRFLFHLPPSFLHSTPNFPDFYYFLRVK